MLVLKNRYYNIHLNILYNKEQKNKQKNAYKTKIRS